MSRVIQPKLEMLTDQKLKNVPLAQLAFKNRDPRLLLSNAASIWVGTREKTGNNDGEEIELFQKTVDGVAAHESYCAAFMESMIAYVEKKLGIKSPMFSSEHCLTIWARTPIEQRVKFNPLPGAVVIWQHGNTTQGHTGIVLASDEKVFHAVEANTDGGQDPNGKVVRDGGGVYFTQRSRAGNGDMKVVGFLKPF